MAQGEPECFAPSVALLAKIGSAVVHADEAMSVNGTAEDEGVFRSALLDPEVQTWLEQMHELAMLPVKR